MALCFVASEFNLFRDLSNGPQYFYRAPSRTPNGFRCRQHLNTQPRDTLAYLHRCLYAGTTAYDYTAFTFVITPTLRGGLAWYLPGASAYCLCRQTQDTCRICLASLCCY